MATINYLIKSQEKKFLGRDDLLKILKSKAMTPQMQLLARMNA
jgi:hypothetical protein